MTCNVPAAPEEETRMRMEAKSRTNAVTIATTCSSSVTMRTLTPRLWQSATAAAISLQVMVKTATSKVRFVFAKYCRKLQQPGHLSGTHRQQTQGQTRNWAHLDREVGP